MSQWNVSGSNKWNELFWLEHTTVQVPSWVTHLSVGNCSTHLTPPLGVWWVAPCPESWFNRPLMLGDWQKEVGSICGLFDDDLTVDMDPWSPSFGADTPPLCHWVAGFIKGGVSGAFQHGWSLNYTMTEPQFWTSDLSSMWLSSQSRGVTRHQVKRFLSNKARKGNWKCSPVVEKQAQIIILLPNVRGVYFRTNI